MADFYKGYFDDRYSFAHSDKKWYNKNKERVRDYNHNYYEAHKKTDTKNRFYKGNTSDMHQNPSQSEIDEMEGGTIFTQNGRYCVKTFDGRVIQGGSAAGVNSLKAIVNQSKSIVKRYEEEQAIEKDRKVRKVAGQIDEIADRFGNKRQKKQSAQEQIERAAAYNDRYRKEILADKYLFNRNKEKKEMSMMERAQKLAAEQRRRRV